MAEGIDINEVLKQCSLLHDRSHSPPSVLLMTSDRFHRLEAEIKQRHACATDTVLPLTALYGMQIEHFENMAALYDRAAELVRDGTRVGIIADEQSRPNPPQFLTNRSSPLEFPYFDPRKRLSDA